MKLYESKGTKCVYNYQEIDIKDLTIDEIICTYAFQLALFDSAEYDCLLFRYSLSNYSEEKVNIYKKDSQWEVSIGERGNAHHIKTFDSCILAYMHALNLLANDEKHEKRLLLAFSEYLMKDYTKEQLGNFERLHILSDEDSELLLSPIDTTTNYYEKVSIVRKRVLDRYKK